MIINLGDVLLRRPESSDVEALQRQKNDPNIAMQLGGFRAGYSRADIVEWVERHRTHRDEIVWVMASVAEGACLGHVGLYQIDHRIRSAEFAIMIGEPNAQGRGLGKRITRAVLDFGFDMLNLNRVSLSVLRTNARARRLYEGIGFRHEGTLRQAQFKGGSYVDVDLMSLLRDEHHARPG